MEYPAVVEIAPDAGSTGGLIKEALSVYRFHRRTQTPLASEAEDWVAATASLATIHATALSHHATVVLMDVLEYSLAETVEILSTTLAAVKAALHGGRDLG